MISLRIKSPDDCALRSDAELEAVLAPMRFFMEAVKRLTYSEVQVTVGGGADFEKTYPTFDEMDSRLRADLRAAREASEEASVDQITVEFTKRLRPNGLTSLLKYTRGEIVIDNCEDEDAVYEGCCEEIAPYLYYKW